MHRATALRFVPLVAALMTTSAVAAGEVSMPLADWRQIEDEIARLQEPPPPPVGFALASRTVIAAFSRGVLTGSLDVDIVVYDDKQVLVPLLDETASLTEVLVDGKRAVALREGNQSGVVVTGVGRHTARIAFALGQEQDRFERAFELNLPQAPRSRLSLELPERDLDVRIQGGVVLDEQTHGNTTHIEGAIDASGHLVVHWARRALHESGEKRELETRVFTLAQLGEEVVTLKTVVAVRVVAGETDRIDVAVPSGLEVVSATGPAVLQWFTKGDAQKTLVILLKHIVDDACELTVEAQMPRAHSGPTTLAFLTPKDARVREGFVAVEGRAGSEVKSVAVSGALDVGAREIPQRLLELSDKPLLFGYRYEDKAPSIGLDVKENAQLDLTQAVIDEMQVSTVIVEKGTEVTKLKLAVRNNTRQYLSMHMPKGAVITHALIDGAPFHPAVEKGGDDEKLLVPLRQSEKLSSTAPRRHVVQPGETLGGIALLYFNKTEPWHAIMTANPAMKTQNDLVVGRAITIPASAGGVTLEESSFVLEIAYKVPGTALGAAGHRAVKLPHLDIPVMAATWHLYMPASIEPLSIDSNLKQMNAIRYDPMRRVQHFIDAALRVQGAWAGEGKYENILQSRKAIYRKEQSRSVDEPLASFPLVGERYRFEQVLLGERQAALDVVYLQRNLEPWVRVAALLLSIAAVLAVVRRVLSRKLKGALVSPASATAGVVLAVLAMLGHYVLGVHRMVLLGADLAIIVAVAPPLWRHWRDRAVVGLARPLPFGALLRLSTLGKIVVTAIVLVFALKTPLLLTTFVLIVLIVVTVRLHGVRHV